MNILPPYSVQNAEAGNNVHSATSQKNTGLIHKIQNIMRTVAIKKSIWFKMHLLYDTVWFGHYCGRSISLHPHCITIAYYSRKDGWLIEIWFAFFSDQLKFTLLLRDSGQVSGRKIYTLELCLPNYKLLHLWRDVRLPVIPARPGTDVRIRNLVRRPWRHRWSIAFAIKFQSDNPPSNFFTDTS